MNNLVPQTSLLVQSLGWALFQSLWQGLLIYGCLRIVLAFSGKQSAKLRYLLSISSLTVIFMWFLDTWAEQWFRLRSATVFITQAGAEATPIKTTTLVTIPQAAFNSNILSRILAEVQPYLPLAVGLYLLGLFFMLGRFGISIYEVRKLRHKGITIPASDLSNWIQSKKEQLFISRPVQLFYSIYAKVPMTIGSLKPVILMPIAMAGSLSTEQLEAILLHELAHIKRNDYLLNIFQAIAETILFFNPFVWLSSSIVRREREHCCDDLVLSCTEGPLPYAKALAALEAYRSQASQLALAATGNKNRLLHRIKRIMEMKKQKNNYTTAIIATLVIAALVISIAWFSPSFAQSHKAKGKTNTTHSSNIGPRPPKSPKPAEPVEAVEAPEAPEPPEANEAPETAEAPEAPNWDERDRELKKADKELDKANKEMADVDWAQINKEMKKANKEMAAIDWDQIGREMEQAGKEVAKAGLEIAQADWPSLDRNLAQAKKELDAVNWNQVQREIDKGLREAQRSIRDPKVRKQVEESLELARKQSQKAIAQSRKALEEAERSRKSHSSYNMAVTSSSAGSGGTNSYVYSNGSGSGNSYSYSTGGKGHGSSSVSLTASHTTGPIEDMLHKMEKDGLLDRSKSYKVEKYSDRLYINGQLQPADIYKRYSKYMENKQVAIKGDRDYINISMTD